jgi:hypothetical protein
MLLRKMVDHVDFGFPAANLNNKMNYMTPSALVIACAVITAKLT